MNRAAVLYAVIGYIGVSLLGLGDPGLQIQLGPNTEVTGSFASPPQLAPGQFVRVGFEGLSPEQARIACVALRARPIGGTALPKPLFRCDGKDWVSLSGNSARCGIDYQYSPAVRSGVIAIPWNSNTDLRGPYEVQVEVLLNYPNGVWGLWQKTPWLRVELCGEQGTPPFLIRLEQPADGSEFALGSRVEVSGRLWPPDRVRAILLTVRPLDGQVTTPRSFSIAPSSDGSFRFVFDTAELRAGAYEIQVSGTSTSGDTLIARQSIRVRLLPREPSEVVVDGTPLTNGDTIEKEISSQIQFCIMDDALGRVSGSGSLLWDFGDGAVSGERCPRHAYLSPGTYRVKLAVYSQPGLQGAVSTVEFSVVVRPRPPALEASREVLGFPNPCEGSLILLPGVAVHSRIRVHVLKPVQSLAVIETLPQDWGVIDETAQQDLESAFRIEPVRTLDVVEGSATSTYVWLVLPQKEIIPAGTCLEIRYQIVPKGIALREPSQDGHSEPVRLQGLVQARVPVEGTKEFPVGGDFVLTVGRKLPIPVAVAHLRDDGTIEGKKFGDSSEGPNYTISGSQWQALIQAWEHDGEVPFTMQKITWRDMLVVADYYINKVPVTECIK